jgi:hypothetical protein
LAGLTVFLAGFLAVLLTLAGRAFVCGFFDGFSAGVRAALRAVGSADFLRVFLDIRLPFVAFGGSIKGIAGLASARWNQAARWASLMAPEYGYKEYDAPPVRSLTALLGPGDEYQY